jgi:hypothetical protein
MTKHRPFIKKADRRDLERVSGRVVELYTNPRVYSVRDYFETRREIGSLRSKVSLKDSPEPFFLRGVIRYCETRFCLQDRGHYRKLRDSLEDFGEAEANFNNINFIHSLEGWLTHIEIKRWQCFLSYMYGKKDVALDMAERLKHDNENSLPIALYVAEVAGRNPGEGVDFLVDSIDGLRKFDTLPILIRDALAVAIYSMHSSIDKEKVASALDDKLLPKLPENGADGLKEIIYEVLTRAYSFLESPWNIARCSYGMACVAEDPHEKMRAYDRACMAVLDGIQIKKLRGDEKNMEGLALVGIRLLENIINLTPKDREHRKSLAVSRRARKRLYDLMPAIST